MRCGPPTACKPLAVSSARRSSLARNRAHSGAGETAVGGTHATRNRGEELERLSLDSNVTRWALPGDSRSWRHCLPGHLGGTNGILSISHLHRPHGQSSSIVKDLFGYRDLSGRAFILPLADRRTRTSHECRCSSRPGCSKARTSVNVILVGTERFNDDHYRDICFGIQTCGSSMAR